MLKYQLVNSDKTNFQNKRNTIR